MRPPVAAHAALEARLVADWALDQDLEVDRLDVLLDVGLLLTVVAALGARPHVVDPEHHGSGSRRTI